MKAVKITPTLLKGEINIPPSKSLSHRAVIAAALAEGQSVINNIAISEDISATLEGIQALGAYIKYSGSELLINGNPAPHSENVLIDCRESGSTLRFLMPIGLLSEGAITYAGRGNLGKRPLDPYLEIFKSHNIYYSSPILPMKVHGKLKPGSFSLKGSISSQFITGLMFALPLLDGDSEIFITDTLESRSYVDLTIEVLNSFGVHIENNKYKSFFIKGNQKYIANEYTIEGDYSQAAFWLAAGALNGNVVCKGLRHNSAQGDKAFIDIFKAAGAQFAFHDGAVSAAASGLKAFQVDVSQCPDIAPILAVAAALSQGTSRITGAARLRIKECDRLKAIAAELAKLGADVVEGSDSLTIRGRGHLRGGEVDSWGDHRIAMAMSVAALRCDGPVVVRGSDAVNKSYPDFYKDFAMLGGNVHEFDLG